MRQKQPGDEIIMSDTIVDRTVLLTLVRTIGGRTKARILVDSIRSFGETMSQCPIWLFEANPKEAPCQSMENMGVHVLPLSVPDTLRHYFFADKVCACAQAESLATVKIQSLIWIDPSCLVIKPPLLFDLGQSHDAAVRPVHIRNVGLPPTEPLDGFWKKIYQVVGVKDIQATVETFVDVQRIRSYFNSHAFAINPSKGTLSQWLDTFEDLVRDEEFQSMYCQDELHRIFLHQAILSALLTTSLDPKRIRILPPDYNYPYNLHQSVPLDRRALSLNDLVCIAYEDRPLNPNVVDDINIREPLRSWLVTNTAPG
jgi:hypothetical protein